MFNNFLRIVSIVFVLALTACATPDTVSPTITDAEIEREKELQKELVINQAIKEEIAVYEIGYPILKANADICPEQGYDSGFAVWNKYDFPSSEYYFAQKTFGLSGAMEVQYVLPGKPADIAGLKKGDVITNVNGTAIPSGKKARKTIAKEINDSEDRILKLTVLRGGKEIPITVNRDKSCKYHLIYDSSANEVNAYADGENITIARGMYRFADDNELALVIAHELAHNIMGHIDKMKHNAAGAGIAGLAIDLLAAYYGVNTGGEFTNHGLKLGSQAYSIEFEKEADYVAMYILAKAGYDTSGVANFWRRMVSENNSGSIKSSWSHPSTPERFLAIEKTHKEIMAKKATGNPLTPNLASSGE